MGNIPVVLFSFLDRDIAQATGKSVSFYKDLDSPLPDFSYADWCCYSLVKSLGKKFLPENSDALNDACLAKFLSCNSRAGAWENICNTSLDEELVGTFKTRIYEFLTPRGMPLVDSLDTLFLNGRLGPGAAIGSVGGDFYTKLYSSKLSCTSRALVIHYQANVRRWAEWANAETTRQANYGDPNIVQGSRLNFVPKNDKISRSICVEPVLNMYYQLGLGEVLTQRLQSFFGINLSEQQNVNREMAREGSRGGSWCTIDLESASDTISLRMIRALFPREFVSYLELLRSPYTTVNGVAHELGMVSSMGNGFTFPLQTAIFACVVSSAYASLGIPVLKGASVNFAVYGDDIIVDRRAWGRVLRLLDLLGFRANVEKSFSEGPFRESCGGDYLQGNNIRGVYIQRLDTPQDWYAVINSVNDFTARTGLILDSLMEYLVSRVDSDVEVPAWEDPSSGIRIPLRLKKIRLKDKYFQSEFYFKFTNIAEKIKIGSGFIRPHQGKRRIYNPSGLLLAFLSGMELSSGITVRVAPSMQRWRKKRASCSSWDTLLPDVALKGDFDWQQWETAVHLNFKKF